MNRHRLIPIFIAAVAWVAAACAVDSQPTGHTVALTGATVWDGTGGSS